MIEFIIEHAHTIFHIFLLGISMIWVNYDFIKRTEEFWESIKGKDKILQITEMCIYVWIRLLPIIILTDLFLDLTLEEAAWYSLDAIFFGLIAGDLGYVHLRKKDGEGTSNKTST